MQCLTGFSQFCFYWSKLYVRHAHIHITNFFEAIQWFYGVLCQLNPPCSRSSFQGMPFRIKLVFSVSLRSLLTFWLKSKWAASAKKESKASENSRKRAPLQLSRGSYHCCSQNGQKSVYQYTLKTTPIRLLRGLNNERKIGKKIPLNSG